MAHPLVTVGVDEILTVAADPNSYGTVFQDGTSLQWTVGHRAPLRLGPGLYRIETVKGQVQHSVSGGAVTVLAATLPRATEIVAAGADVAAAIVNKGKPAMALSDKAKLLAARVKAVPQRIGDRMDAAGSLLDSADSRADAALTRLETVVIADVENSAREIEDVANQLTNALADVPNG